MLPPELIDKLRREKEERERTDARIPLYPPDMNYTDSKMDDEEKTESKRVFVIDL